MDSGRFLLAVVLMIALVVITNLLFPPVAPVPPPEVGLPADTIATPTPAPPVLEPAPPHEVRPEPARPAEAAPTDPAGAAADTLTVESDLYRFGFSTLGASIVSAELKPFESATRPGPVELKPDDAPFLIAYRIRLGDRVYDLSRLPFVVQTAGGALSEDAMSAADRSAEESASADGSALEDGPRADTLRFVHTPAEPGQLGIEITYVMDPENYLINVRARVTGAGAQTPQLLIDFAPTVRVNEASARDDEHALAYVVNNIRNGISSVNLRDVRAERIEEGPLHWTAVKNKYFVVAAIVAEPDPTPFGGLIARPSARPFSAEMTTTLLTSPEGAAAFRLYVGPQEIDRLAAIGYDLRDVSPFGWKALQPVLRPLGHGISWALVSMHRVLGVGYGWVLVLFGIIIRIVLWPLNAKAMRSQLKNMEIQPRLKEIQAKYKAEPERLQKEMLRLYKEEGFNPMGGCLPMLIPFPILIALFFVFQSTIAFRGESFLWLPDLSRADPYYILPVLLGVSMFLLQWLSMRTTKDVNPQMKFMMYFMPIFMTVIFLNFASGLNLYYASMNLASVPQQLQIMRERKRWQATRPPPKSG